MAPGQRVFDIDLQGSTVESGYDIFADAGAANTATAQTFTVTVTGGQGIQLSLVNDTLQSRPFSRESKSRPPTRWAPPHPR